MAAGGDGGVPGGENAGETITPVVSSHLVSIIITFDPNLKSVTKKYFFFFSSILTMRPPLRFSTRLWRKSTPEKRARLERRLRSWEFRRRKDAKCRMSQRLHPQYRPSPPRKRGFMTMETWKDGLCVPVPPKQESMTPPPTTGISGFSLFRAIQWRNVPVDRRVRNVSTWSSTRVCLHFDSKRIEWQHRKRCIAILTNPLDEQENPHSVSWLYVRSKRGKHSHANILWVNHDQRTYELFTGSNISRSRPSKELVKTKSIYQQFRDQVEEILLRRGVGPYRYILSKDTCPAYGTSVDRKGIQHLVDEHYSCTAFCTLFLELKSLNPTKSSHEIWYSFLDSMIRMYGHRWKQVVRQFIAEYRLHM